MLDDRGVEVRFQSGARELSIESRQALRSNHPPMQWTPGAVSPGVKRQGQEVERFRPSSAQVKNGGAIT
jgi:hypothetical protein